MNVVITLPNGMQLSGTEEQVVNTATKLGFSNPLTSEYYHSATHGWLKIKEMNTTHLRNSMLKMYAGWVDSLHEIRNPKKVVQAILDGCQDKTWRAMLVEYSKHEEE